MKIALNKTYLTNDGKLFSPIKTKLGKEFPWTNMMGNKLKQTSRGEMTFLDKNGIEYKRSELKREIKINK